MCLPQKDFKTFGLPLNPIPQIVLDEIKDCYGCEEPHKGHLYDFGNKLFCSECLISNIMVDLEEEKFSTDRELADWYFDQGVELDEAKKMIAQALDKITTRNLELRQSP